MPSYVLFGVCGAPIYQVRVRVEDIFGSAFEERESLYQGGVYYIFGERSSEHFVLKMNVDPYGDEPPEDDFPSHQVLLYINSTERALEIIEMLSSEACFEFLRNESF